MSRVVVALARTSARHRWLVLTLWLLVAAGLLAGSRALGDTLTDELSVPGSDSATATALIERAAADAEAPVGTTPDAPDDAATSFVLVAADGPVAERADDVAALAERLRAVEGVVAVTDPLAGDAPGAPGAPGATTGDGRAVQLRVTATDDVDVAALADTVESARADGLEVGVGYPLLRDLEPGLGSRTSEVVGVVAAVVVLLLVLGAALAAAVPIATALLTVAAGLGALHLIGGAVAVPTVVPTLATMIGLGVGIDYALFQVARHQEVLAAAKGDEDRAALAAATAATAGEAVAFAGVTVAVAISALAVTGVDFVSWLGFGTAVVVVVVLLGSLTFTPALVAAVGPRLVRRRRPARAGTAPDAPPEGRADTLERLDGTRWARFGAAVARRPWLATGLSLALLGLLGAPAVTLTLGQSSDADRPVGSERRTTYDLVSEHLGAGANGTLVVAAELDPPAAGAADPRPAAVHAALARTPGIVTVAPGQLSADGSVVTYRVEPEAGPADVGALDAVEAMRALDPGDGATVHVGGTTAVRMDLSERIAERLPWLILATVAVAALLLMVAFRSVVLPLKAAAMDLVSVVAAYGVVTAVFEWGWGAGLLGLDGPVAIDSYVPMLLFAVLFGLSMDYEVFLLSAIRDHWRETGDTSVAVRRGLASTGRIITAAATIMLAVFGSFVLVDDPVIKVFGVGLAVAVVVDATVVRCVLGPAVMVLAGRWNWWMPALPSGGLVRRARRRRELARTGS